jgi:hypothetical protein
MKLGLSRCFYGYQPTLTITALGDQLGTILVLALGFLQTAFTTLLTAVDLFWVFVDTSLMPLLSDLWTEISTKLQPVFDGLAVGITSAKDALQPFIDLIGTLKTAISTLDVDALWALIGQSPSPLAVGVNYANTALEQMTSSVLPKLNAEFDVIGNSLNKNLGALADVGNGGGDTSNFNTTINSNQPAGQLVRASRYQDKLMSL